MAEKKNISQQINNIPDICGVYLMRDKKGKILYIGKAKRLRRRLYTHFRKGSPKAEVFKQRVDSLEYIPCRSQEQALLLEAALIKENRPSYNIALRDDKSYPYVQITKEDFPVVSIVRLRKKRKALYFGPYPNAGVIKEAMKLIRRFFPYRSCLRLPAQPCLYYHLRLCPGVCIGKITKKEYAENIKQIINILRGKRKELFSRLKKRMNALAEEKQYEQAARIRDTLIQLKAIYEGNIAGHELIALRNALKLKNIPLVIEAIDISNIGATDAVGSVVTFKDGAPYKQGYRRFKIKTVKKISDFAMIAEVVLRRYRRLLKEKKSLPGLILIDGGSGQVNTAKKVLDKLKINIPIIGLAKRNEEIWFPYRSKPLVFAKDNPALQLLQRVRDEAHRFAHTYHVWRRHKSSIGKVKEK